MPYSVKGFFEINEDVVQILLMLVHSTTDSVKKNLTQSQGLENRVNVANPLALAWANKIVMQVCWKSPTVYEISQRENST